MTTMTTTTYTAETIPAEILAALTECRAASEALDAQTVRRSRMVGPDASERRTPMSYAENREWHALQHEITCAYARIDRAAAAKRAALAGHDVDALRQVIAL